ncbi:MAG: AbrB family transcriptional regulator [Candidatus Melainabacteria bacterium GWA2_34_9]|nr:MAG: AbrB family transcriptional regulator [Candidatus Melainabacteria bacterium GWA2_34_9]
MSKLTKKCQTTIPSKVRDFLGIKAGDNVDFEIKDNVVILKKLNSIDYEYLKSVESTLEEWNSPEDDEAYSDL